MNKQYSKEFKLHVINTYLESPHGIRVIARSFGLPTKNYVTKWLKDLLAEGVITEDQLIIAGKKSNQRHEITSSSYEIHSLSVTEKQLAEENLRLRAEVDLLKKLLSPVRRSSLND